MAGPWYLESASPAARAAWDALIRGTGNSQVSMKGIPVISGHRTAERNAAVGGAKNSQHIHGNAFDLDVSSLSQEDRIFLIQKAREAGFGGIGVYDNSLHFDVGAQRAWGPSYHGDSVPAWAAEALGVPAGTYYGAAAGGAPAAAPASAAAPVNALAGYDVPERDPATERLNRLSMLQEMLPQTSALNAADFQTAPQQSARNALADYAQFFL